MAEEINRYGLWYRCIHPVWDTVNCAWRFCGGGGISIEIGGTGIFVSVGVKPAQTMLNGRCTNNPIITNNANRIAIQYCRFCVVVKGQ